MHWQNLGMLMCIPFSMSLPALQHQDAQAMPGMDGIDGLGGTGGKQRLGPYAQKAGLPGPCTQALSQGLQPI
jgi:hypothetical protein